jgi:hypothetical protein
MMSDPTLQWLLEGDPSIRWQVMRDLLDRPAKQWRAEQQCTLTEGWAAALLARRDPDGRWGGGLFSPKWTSTTYTLLLLRDLGLPRGWCSTGCSAWHATHSSRRDWRGATGVWWG